ncbi:MAG: peptide deformylase [Anaerolineae bacterium]|nr:peptide deformylase [Anaerolineae bacterium]MDW8101331.1 peptide deformylase [Anaerolineae bacterium]
MVRRILTGDDPRLRVKSREVTQFNQELKALIQDMIDTMRAAKGIGLAAIQIGVPFRVIVVELPPEEGNGKSRVLALVNPEIVKMEGEEETEEGCLSLPGIVGDVKRAAYVEVRARTPNGKKVRIKASGLLSRVLQHEIDHTNGILFTDRISDPAKIRYVEAEEVGAGEI